jgi:membrane protein required for colicin V production
MGDLSMTDLVAMNPCDAAVYACLFIAVVMGFLSGLLRSLATIFGYIGGMGVAVATAPPLTPVLSSQFHLSPAQGWLVFGGIFLAAGFALGVLLRFTVGEMTGSTVSVPDRVAGAALGAVRVGLLAVLLVVVFDRIIPPGREPAFLRGSQWRPVLSKAGQAGLQKLPPDIEAYIDRLKRQRGL